MLFIPSFPSFTSSCLVTHLSWKLCFLGVATGWGAEPVATPTKRSFADDGVPKLELGHEG